MITLDIYGLAAPVVVSLGSLYAKSLLHH